MITVTVTEQELRQHDNDLDGVCLECGEWTFGQVDPDGRKRKCHACGEFAVYGAMEALIMGNLDFGEEDGDA